MSVTTYDVEVQQAEETALIVETSGPTTSEWDGVVPGIVEVTEPVQIPTIVEVEVRGIPGPRGPSGIGGDGGDSTVYEHRFEIVSDFIVYRGEAVPGTSPDAPEWRVKRISISYGVQIGTTTDFANGDAGFVHTWADRAAFNYGD